MFVFLHFCNLYFCIFFRHLVCLPPLGHNQRFKFEQESRHLLQPVSVLALRIVLSFLFACIPFKSSEFHNTTSTPGLHAPPPHPDQCRQGGQVSWQEVRGAARGSWPSSQARLASSTGLPAGSPRWGGSLLCSKSDYPTLVQ